MTRCACVGDVGLVGDEHDGVARLVEALEERHDLDAGLRVEVAGGLVGEQDRRIVHQRARDGDALALAAGELVRAGGSCGRRARPASSASRARVPARSFADTPA